MFIIDLFVLIGSSIGIILPSGADELVFDLLEDILHGIISQVSKDAIGDWQQRRREEAGLEDYSTRISNKIVDGMYNEMNDMLVY